jgi:hypothetical protein
MSKIIEKIKPITDVFEAPTIRLVSCESEIISQISWLFKSTLIVVRQLVTSSLMISQTEIINMMDTNESI